MCSPSASATSSELLHDVERVGQRLGQRADALGGPLLGGHLEDVATMASGGSS